MISTIKNISHTQNTIQTNRFSAPKVSFNFQNKDNISFSGFTHNVQKTTDSNEIKELIKIFQNSLEININGKLSQPSKFYVIRKFKDFMKKLSTLPYEFTAKQPDAITEIVKNNNKIVGGFSTITDTTQSSLYIGLLTVAPEYKNTKNLRLILKTMGEEIKNIAEKLNLKKISWSVNDKNRPVLNLIKRFKNTNKTFLNNTENIYTVNLQDFANALENI